MSKIIVFGDTHIRTEEPFYSAIEDFFGWVHDQEWNNSDNYGIHVGDLFHSNSPTPKDYSVANWALDGLMLKKLHIMSGNGIHEYNRSKKMYAIDGLSERENVHIIKKPMEWVIEGINILFLPWVPSSMNNISMKEYYSGYETQQKPDYVFGHFAHRPFFDTEINVDHIPGKKRMGHIHIPTEEYVGVNVISRYDEKGIDCSLIEIDTETLDEKRIPIPKFLDYATIEYGNVIDSIIEHYVIYDIVNAPSKEKAESEYSQYYIRNIYVKNSNDANDTDKSNDMENVSINGLFDSYAKQNNISINIKKLIKKVI